MNKVGLRLFSILFLLAGSTALAGSAETSPEKLFEETGDDVQCTMITFVRPVLPVSQSLLSKESVNHIIPTNMTPGTNENLFAAQFQSGVQQKISEDILAGDLFRTSALGKATSKVEKLSQTSLLVGGKNAAEKSNIEFKLKIPERQAVITYKGPINSEIIYAVDQSSFKWTLSRVINKSTSLAWTNIGTPSTGLGSSVLSLSHSF